MNQRNEDDNAWPPDDPGSDNDVHGGREDRSSRPAEYFDEMFARREGRSRSRGVPDFVRRAIENTMGSVQNTQNVSKEALQFFLSTTDKTRREIVRIAASEVGEFLRQSDIASEVIKVLTSLEADVQVRVKFRRTDSGVRSDIENQKKDTADVDKTPSSAPDDKPE